MGGTVKKTTLYIKKFDKDIGPFACTETRKAPQSEAIFLEPVALILKLPLQWQALVKIETDPDAKQDLLPLQIHV